MIGMSRRRLLGSAAALALSGMGSPVSGQSRRITIGANPPGTDYFSIGGALAKAFGDKLGLPAIVQPYAGSSVYLPLIEQNEVTAGLSSSLDSGGAFRGEQGRKPMPKLRAIARLWPLAYAYIVRGDSGLKTIADLRGKRVVLDIKANAALGEANRAMLRAGGLKPEDVTAVTIGGLPQGMQAMEDGSLDATTISAGSAIVREAHAAVPGGVRYLDITGPDATDAFIGEQVAGIYTYRLKPSPVDPEITEPVTVSAYDIFLIANEALAAATSAGMLETIWEGWAQLQNDYPTLRRGQRTEFSRASNTVPYHPAAVAFFKGKKIWTEANDTHEASLTPKG